jgi:centrosomal protein CEP104
VSFTVVACSSEEYGTNSELICTQPFASQKSWESSRTAKFPVEIVLRFAYRCEIEHAMLCSKPEKNIPDVEFQFGDGLSGSFLDVDYRLAGKGSLIDDKISQCRIHGFGTYMKLIFKQAPKRSKHNPFGQVSIGGLRFWGREVAYQTNIKNEAMPLTNDKSNIDKILISLGMPLDLIAWFDEDDRNFEYAPIDDETRITLRDLQRFRDLALKDEDYEAMKQLSIDIRKVFDIGREIWQLQKDLEVAVAKEDFLKAIEIREKLRKLTRIRDTYDALYETSRYEDMIIMQRPSSAAMREEQWRLDEEDRLNAEKLRRQKELEEQERRRLLEEALRAKKGLAGQDGIDMTPFWEKNKGHDLGGKKKFQKKKEENDGAIDIGFKNIFNYNEGDVDLELYFKPLLNNAGESLKEINVEVLRRLHHLGYLTVFGARVWTGMHNESWRVREAAAQAVLNFIEMPLLEKYLNGKSKRLFLASMEVAKIACEDKLLQIYFIGLKILSTALAPPVCGNDISPQIINKVLKEFIPILIAKVSELNYRARDISLHTLISIFRHPAAQVGNLIVGCMDLCDIEDDIRPKNNGPIDKQQWRLVLARLEIILHILQEFGYDPNEWNWEPVFRHLISPSLFHGNVDVRLVAVELCATFYQILGQEIRIAVNNVENLKPNLLMQINQRMDEIDEIQMQQNQEAVEAEGLSRVDEALEPSETSPTNTQTKFQFDAKSRQGSMAKKGSLIIKQEYQADDIKDKINQVMNEEKKSNDPKSKPSLNSKPSQSTLKTNAPSANNTPASKPPTGTNSLKPPTATTKTGKK